MCMGGRPSMPSPQMPPAAAPLPNEVDPGVQRSRTANRAAAALAGGRSSSLLTGPGGLMAQATTDKKSLLGM